MLLGVLLLVLPLLVIAAALSDIRTMTIPNGISLALIAAFVLAAAAAGLSWGAFGLHLALGLAALLLGMGAFALRWLGGGDAKLMAAVVLWLGPAALLPFVLWTALAGGALSLILLSGRNHAPILAGVGPLWSRKLFEPKGDIPYGVAIAAGALVAFPSSALMTALA